MHVFTYAHMLLHAWLVTYVHGRSYYPMLTHECSLMNAHTLSCFHDHMLPRSHSLLIICYYAACFEDNMLSCTHTLIFTCLISTHVHTLGWWYVSMFGTLSDRVVTHQMFWRWHALMHTYIDFHMFDIHTRATLGWWYVSMFGTLSDRAVAHLYAQMLWRLCLNA